MPLSRRTRYPSVRALLVAVTLACLAAPALHAQYFGRSKVKYKDFDWRIYHSVHFDVHYYPEEEHLLEKVVSFAESAYDAIYGCYMENLQRMVRVGDWKLIVYPRAKAMRLFNLADDPDEADDLAGNPVQRDRMAKLFQRLLQLQRELDDPLDLVELFPELAGE